MIAPSARGGGPPPFAPQTLGELLGDSLSTRGVPEFLAEIDANTDTPLEVFFSATEEDLTQALGSTTLEGAALSVMTRAGVIRVVRGLFESAGYEPPLLGTVARRPVAPPSAPPSTLAVAAPAPPAAGELDGDLESLAQYVDQASRQHARRLTYDEVRALRATYVAACGAPPPEEHLPTS